MAATCLAGAVSPGLANIAPESGLLVHVRPVSHPCYAEITDCHDIVRSTPSGGTLEFVIFFMRGAFGSSEPVCLSSVTNELAWPDDWQLIESSVCGDGWIWPDGAGAGLFAEWPDWWDYELDEEYDILPVARIVMNVTSPGRMALVARTGENPVWLRPRCASSHVVTWPAQSYAEAGMDCGYVSAHCGYSEDACAAIFDSPELLLSAPSGGAAEDSLGYRAEHQFRPDRVCPLMVDPGQPWCTAWIVPQEQVPRGTLHVRADATGLPDGLYQSDIMLYNDTWHAARCLPVILTVEEPTRLAIGSWGRIKALYH